MGETRNAYKILSENLKVRDHLEDMRRKIITPWSRVRLEKSICTKLATKFRVLYENRRFITNP
jgi:IS1 family transposase